MLVLSRKEGESITIDGCIHVTVIRLAGGRVRLGIEAPQEVSILRSELSQKPLVPRVPAVRSRSNPIAAAPLYMASVAG